jgi:hypothetical protein
MRNGHQHQNKQRMRGRNNNNNNNSNRGGGKNHNPLTRVYESNGPDIKIRGTANHVAEKYLQLARDATSSGDPVAAENYFQHAEHYFRMIATAQEQFRQSQPFPRPEGAPAEMRDDGNYDEGEDDGSTVGATGNDQHSFAAREPQPYMPRDNQFYQPREQQPPQRSAQYDRPRDQQYDRRPNGNSVHSEDEAPGLPSFITGGAPSPTNGVAPSETDANGAPLNGQTGLEGGQGDRFPLHRRRRRHRGPRPELAGAPRGEGDGPSD